MAAVTVLCVVTGGALVWALTRDESDDAGRAGRLDVQEASFAQGRSLTGDPGKTWFFDPTSIAGGATLGPLFWDMYGPGPGAYAFDDTVVVRVQDSQDWEAGTTLVGLDSADGSVRWQLDEPAGLNWWAPSTSALLCEVGGMTGLQLMDPHTGKVRASSELNSSYGTPELVDGVLYLLSYDGDGDESVAALEADTLDVIWRTPQSGVAEYQGDPSKYRIGVAGREVRVAYPDGSVVEFDRTTGAVTEIPTDESGDHYLTHEGGWQVHQDWEAESAVTRVYDAAGRLALTAPGSAWPSEDHRSGPVRDDLIGIGTALYDLDTGEPRWQRGDLDPDAYWMWTEDRRNVILPGEFDDEVLDAATGQTRWTRDSSTSEDGSSDVIAFRGDGALVADPHAQTLTALDREDGSEQWTRDLHSQVAEDLGMVELEIGLGPRTIVVSAAGGVDGFTDFPTSGGRNDAEEDDEVAFTTKCGSPPTFVPVESELAGGGITITYVVQAVCPCGQWLNLSQLRVPVVVDDYTYADGYFDFSRTPYWIPDDDGDGAVRLRLTYDFADTAVPYDDMAGAIEADGGTGKVVIVPCEPGPSNSDDAAVPSDPDFSGDTGQPIASSGAPATDDAQTQESALEALQRIAAEDRAAVGELDWTAQLSSKKPGTYDDGKVYDTYDDILALHLEYRSRYPESLLVWSNDWPGSFGPSSQDYWVTVGGQSETTLPVLEWCRAEGWGDGDCWAKRLLTSGNPDEDGRHKDSWPADPSKN